MCFEYIKETFKKDLSLSGIRLWLKRNDFTFKKPKIVPANTDPIAQQKFTRYSWENDERSCGFGGASLIWDQLFTRARNRGFLDRLGQKGKRSGEIPSTAGRIKLNIMGGLNLETMNCESIWVWGAHKKWKKALISSKMSRRDSTPKGSHHKCPGTWFGRSVDIIREIMSSHPLKPVELRFITCRPGVRIWSELSIRGKDCPEFACNNISSLKFSDFCRSHSKVFLRVSGA